MDLEDQFPATFEIRRDFITATIQVTMAHREEHRGVRPIAVSS